MTLRNTLHLTAFALLVSATAAHAFAEGVWIWYPGQLQAALQRQCLAESKARCVNVDYPCRYNPPARSTLFRKVGFAGSIEVAGTDATMPALFCRDAHERWEASLDGTNWVPAESDLGRNREDVRPEAWKFDTVTVRPAVAPAGGADFLVDFGTIELGIVKCVASGKGTVSFMPGESVREAQCENLSLHEQMPIPPIAVDGDGVPVELPLRALRYLRVRVTEGSVAVKDFEFAVRRSRIASGFSFESDDPQLDRLVAVGVKTLNACTAWEFHLDGIKRDALPWSMDCMLGALASAWCSQERQTILNDLSIAVMPPDPKASDWGCVDYPLHAIIGFENEYGRYGDLNTFRRYRDRLEAQLALYEAYLDADGFVPATREAFFGCLPSWSRYNGPDSYGTLAYVQMLLKINYDLYGRFYERLGETAKAADCAAKATALATKIHAAYWDAGRHAFVNGSYRDGRPDRRICHHTQYWAILADVFPPSEYGALFDSVLPALPRYYTDVSYEKGYELLAYVKAGRAEDFYRRFLCGVWQDWLDQGHTTFPEQFSPGMEDFDQQDFYGRAFGRSLCHMSTGIVPPLFALRGALGFRVGPKAGTYSFAPRFVGTATRYTARLRVKEGEIAVTFRRGIKAEISAPPGVTVSVEGTNLNGERWLDDRGKPINAHGGGILFHDGRYWWFGEHKGFDAEGHKAKVGVHCYSSANFADWRDEGIALAVSDDPKSDVAKGNVIERPKVVYCPMTGKFSMFFHLELDGHGYDAARVGIAVADRVSGPYRFVRSLRPLARCWPHDVPAAKRTPETLAALKTALDIRTYRKSGYGTMPMFGSFFEGGQMVRDMTLFVDDDGKAYHVYASEGNATLQIAELTDDYLDYTGKFVRVFPAGFNEAPAICKRNGAYFMIASDCTGWKPNACRAYRAENIFGPWHEIGNPCRSVNPANGLGPEKTWGGQSTFILKLADGSDRYVAMFDEWRPDSLGNSRYYWIPVTFTDDDRIEIRWQVEAAK